MARSDGGGAQDEKVADAFVEKFAAKARSLPAGDPRKGNVVLGSMVNKEAVGCVRGLIEDAVSKGAALVTGGKAAINEFTELRWITIQIGPHPYPF